MRLRNCRWLLLGSLGLIACAVPVESGPDTSQFGPQFTGGATTVDPGVGGSVLGAGGSAAATGGSTFAAGGTGFATGGAAPATGGAPPATGGAATGGSNSASPTYPGTKGSNTISSSGLVTSGTWSGYAYTWSSLGSVYPANFAGLDDLCVWGVLDQNYNALMALGINLKQNGDAKELWAMTGSGITYSIQNDGGTPLRLQLNGQTGDYCVDLNSNSGTVAWSDFKEQCWPDGTQTTMTETSFTAINVIAPGDGLSVRKPAYCVLNLAVTP